MRCQVYDSKRGSIPGREKAFPFEPEIFRNVKPQILAKWKASVVDNTGDQNCSTGEAVDDDDEDIITQVPSQHTSHTAFERTHKATTGKASLQTRGKRSQSKSAQSNTAKRTSKNITKYFSSQQ